jgi:hypothetical protein
VGAAGAATRQAASLEGTLGKMGEQEVSLFMVRLLLLGEFVLGLAALVLTTVSFVAQVSLSQLMDVTFTTLGTKLALPVFRFVRIWPFVSGAIVMVLSGIAFRYASDNPKLKARRALLLATLGSPGASGSARTPGSPGAEARGCVSGKCLFTTATIFLTLIFILQGLAGGANILFLNAMNAGIVASATSGSNLDTFGSDLNTLQLATFNKCCFEAGWSNMERVPACNGRKRTEIDCALPSKYSAMKDKLCTCYDDEASYEEYYAALGDRTINTRDVCQVLANSVVHIADQDMVPGTTIPVNSIILSSSIRIVGFPNASANNPEGSGQGFGCGVGIAKGFQWAQLKFADSTLYYISFLMILISIIELLVMCAIALQIFFAGDSRYYDKQADQMWAHKGSAAEPPTPNLKELEEGGKYSPFVFKLKKKNGAAAGGGSAATSAAVDVADMDLRGLETKGTEPPLAR